MKNFKFKWLLLSVVLSVVCINHVWGYNFSNTHVYFDNSNSQWVEPTSRSIYIFLEKSDNGTASQGYNMSKILGTNLFYVNLNWGDQVTYYRFASVSYNTSGWSYEKGDNSSWKRLNGNSNCFGMTGVGSDPNGSDKTLLCVAASATYNNNSAPDLASSSVYNSYTSLNKDQTLNVLLSSDGGSTYSDITSSAWKGTIKASRTYISGNGASTTLSGGSAETLSSSAYTKSAAITSNYSLTESSTVTGYTFAGWGSSDDAISEEGTTYTINGISGTNVIYAFFKANSYTIAYDANGGTGSTSSSTHYYDVAEELTSNGFSKDNYVFAGWNTAADGSGISYSEGQSVSNLSATQGATVKLYAQWKQVLTLGSNGGSTDGSVTVYKDRSDVSIFIEAVKTGYTCTGYFTAGGYKVIAAETGELVYSSDVSSYISSTGKWVNTSVAPSLVAHWIATTYTISFDDGEGSGGDGTIAATYDDKTPVLANTPTREGYNFAGYWTGTGGTGTQVYGADLMPIQNVSGYTDNSSNKLWIHADDVTLYAKWTEATHTVTVNVDHDYAGTFSHGGGSNYTTKDITGVGIITASTDIVASAKNGFIFDSWTTEDDGITINDDDNATTTLNASSNGTVTANFKSDWYLYGTMSPTSWTTEWDNGAFTYVSDNHFRLTIAFPASTSYQFRLYKSNASNHTVSNHTDINNLSNSVSNILMYYNDDNNMSMNTRSGIGTYIFDWDITNTGEGESKLSITFPSSTTKTVTFNSYSVTGSASGVGATSLNAKVGTISLTSGDAVCSGENILFTQTPLAGYSFLGWYSNTDGAEGHLLSRDESYTLSSIDDNKTVYALYRANTYPVTIIDADGTHVLENAVGPEVATSVDYTAADKADCIFASWTVTGTPSYSTGSASTARVVFTATEPITLKANYTELPKVYFQKPESWGDNVWVYFYKGDYWDNTNGTGTNSGGNYTGNHYQMTQIENTNIYYYAYNTTTPTHVAFADVDKSTGTGNFSSCNISYRGDFQTKVPLFVAKSISTGTKNTSAVYYNDGYWRNYNSLDAKFDMRGYDGTVFNSWSEDMYPFVFDSETSNTAKVTINLTGGSNYKIKLFSKASANATFIYNTANYTILPNTCTDLPMSVYNDGNFYIATTATGDYTFTLNFTQDAILLSVDYPVTVGDLYVENTTNGLVSNVLTATSGSDVSGEIAIRLDAGSNSLAIKECTGVTNPVFSSNNTPGSAGSLSTQGAVTWTTKSGTGTSPSPSKAGTYAMTLSRSGSTYSLTTPTAYTNGYYIRTKCAPGRWSDYSRNPMSHNTTNFAENDASTFDYYFCKWISDSERTTTSVRFEVVTKYGNAVAATMVSDATLGGESEVLPSRANVRFSYNSATNGLNRAYLLGSNDDASKYLTMTSISSEQDKRNVLYDATGNEITVDVHKTFEDTENWIYELAVRVYPTAHGKIQAYFNGAYRDLIDDKILMGGLSRGSYRYDIRLVYDFKINKLMSAYIPKNPLKETLDIYADVMLVREHQGEASTITFDNSSYKMQEIKDIYSVMRFSRWTLNNKSKADGHAALAVPKSRYERGLYWISFPYNVRLKDVFGFGEYATHWIIEYYDGVGRAKNGFWADSPSNWKFVTPEMRESGGDDGLGYMLKANEGYILALDLDLMRDNDATFWLNNIEQVELYFPSNDNINTIETTTIGVAFDNQSDYECHIDRRTDKTKPNTNQDRRIVDSYWHCIGVPSFGDTRYIITEGEDPKELEALAAGRYWSPTDKFYLYEWNMEDNTLSVVQSGSPYAFKTMYSYLAQFSKDSMQWRNVSNVTPASIAARLMETSDFDFQLELLYENAAEDRTLIRLTDDAAVSNAFEFNYDLCKEKNSGKGNIWTVTADAIPVAGNSMPKPLQTTIVPVGVKIAANGEYTFSMPEGTNGGDVWLIDNANSSRTNLGLMDYTVNLTTGTYEGRFSLEFPVQNVVTEIENAANANANADVRKVFVGGRLYILRDGKAYDATGAQVR